MNLTDDEVLKFLRGTPILLDDICAIYPATLGEIVDEGYENFQKYLSIMLATKPVGTKDKEMNKMLEQISDFQYILLIALSDPEANQLLRQAFLFFTHEEANFLFDTAEIIIGPTEEKHILNEEKFYELQTILRHMYFVDVDLDDIIINADDPPATKKLKLQMRANREKVKRAKAKQAQREKNDLKLSDLIGSLTLNDCGLNISNIWNITYYAFHDQLKRMGWRDQFKLNNQAAMAGAKLKKSQLKHWIRSIASSDKS